jgi:two-component system C4-dicarboxylate transport sensor histidine kinase DctB
LRERQIQLVRPLLSPDIAVRAERYRLEQVLLNLIQNAVEALKEVADPRITVTVGVEDDRVIVRVSDNGPGVSAEIQDRLFTPFTTDKPDGMGLGLVISRDIVVGFGGDLLLEPTTSGATFSIVLPRAA